MARQSGPPTLAAPLDPLGHLSDFIKTLQQQIKHDSDLITNLGNRVQFLEQGHASMQAELDALKSERVGGGKGQFVGSVPGRAGGEGGVNAGQAQAGKEGKRARSLTATSDNGINLVNTETGDQADPSPIIARLDALESSLLNQVRDNGAALAGTGKAGCVCGEAAHDVANKVTDKIELADGDLTNLIERKMKQLEQAIGAKLDVLEKRVIDATEYNQGGCECGVVEDVADRLERQIEQAKDQIDDKLEDVGDKIESLDYSLEEHLATSNTTNRLGRPPSLHPPFGTGGGRLYGVCGAQRLNQDAFARDEAGLLAAERDEAWRMNGPASPEPDIGRASSNRRPAPWSSASMYGPAYKRARRDMMRAGWDEWELEDDENEGEEEYDSEDEYDTGDYW